MRNSNACRLLTTSLISAGLSHVVVERAHASALPNDAESKTLQVGDVGKRIVQYVQRASQDGFSGPVFAAKGGKPVAAVGVGSADLEGNVANTPATLFEIASATKPFTAAAVMR